MTYNLLISDWFLFLFSRFGAVQPIYFNLIRDPLARLVSSYYYHRFGDFREGRKTWNFKGTAEEKNMVCVLLVRHYILEVI